MSKKHEGALRFGFITPLLVLCCMVAAPAPAQSYPEKPVRMIVPFPPGGSDTVARIVAGKLSTTLNRQIVVDNRAGAGGLIGTELAANAAADGYTLFFVTASFPINVQLYKNLSFDPARAFAPIGLISSGPQVLVASLNLPARTLAEFIDLAKAKPKALNFASTGTGSITHMAAELFLAMSGISAVHIPYKGTGEALTSVMAGQTQFTFVPIGGALSLYRGGKVKLLGIGALKRSSATPEIPTIAESGVPGYEVLTWYGLLSPSGTPAAIISKLNKQLDAVLQQPDVVTQITGLGFDVTPSTPTAFAEVLKTDFNKWREVIRRTGMAK
ncbi:MAG: tripartite tricarboxylate transporter substrate binding protein [Betaproteobacteria bacterium]